MTINAIFLNVDDVMFDTAALHLAACNAALESAGLPLRWTMQELREAACAVGWSRVLEVAVPKQGRSGKGARPIDLNAARDRYFHEAVSACPPAANPACLQLIEDAIQSGCKLAIVSDMPARSCAALLEHSFGNEVNSTFAVVSGSLNAARSAPHAEALRTMGVEPYESLSIDTTEPNLAAARKAGMWTVSLKQPHVPDLASLQAMATDPY